MNTESLDDATMQNEQGRMSVVRQLTSKLLCHLRTEILDEEAVDGAIMINLLLCKWVLRVNKF